MAPINRFAAALLSALAILLIASQWRAIHTENVNWDEFALLSRAHDSIRTGKLVGGGRPGLAVLMLIPLVQDCANSVQAAVSARRLWLGFTVAYLAGVFFLLLQAARGQPYAWRGAAASVALLSLVPAFLRWSLQVRTDQPALMFATWGGVFLLAAARRLPLAMPAGALFALGYLCTPKAAYVAALVLVLLVARLSPALNLRAIAWRRGLAATSLAAASFLTVTALYYVLVSLFYEPQPVQTLQSAFNTFAYYREVFGYRAYGAMLPTLAAHILLVALLVWAVFVSARRTLRHRPALIACWAILLLGYAVGTFHAAAFPYFWMTLGLFPAVAVGLAWNALLEVFDRPLGRALVFAAAPLLLVSAIPAARALHDDTQRVQRGSLAFIDRHFTPAARGFQAHGALFCRRDPSPFPTYFADAVRRQLTGATGRPRAEALIEQFRTRPVTFMIAHRMFRFPEPIQTFWDTHYVMYRDDVMIPGRHVQGRRGESFGFEVIVPGRYRWVTSDSIAAGVAAGDDSIDSGTVFHLDAGIHQFTLLDETSSGLLVLALDENPSPEGSPFYEPQVIREIDPLYPRF